MSFIMETISCNDLQAETECGALKRFVCTHHDGCTSSFSHSKQSHGASTRFEGTSTEAL